MQRAAFFISDHTGLTAEVMGRGLLAQFEDIDFRRVTLRYIDSAEKAQAAVAQIDAAAKATGSRPLVLSTLTTPELRAIIETADALVLDLFERFITPLEQELGTASSHAIGRSHRPEASYTERIDAVNFTLDHDDGGISRNLERAEIVLVGVSRCGKTPTSLYLALQFGIYAANYPLVDEDFASGRLPEALRPLRGKLFGLTIAPERLQQIRAERAPDTRYAQLETCRREVQMAEDLMRPAGIPVMDITHMSVEEIATTIVHRLKLQE
jgi:regulator of PEP synthase PpsR (kinase-PPPase family)